MSEEELELFWNSNNRLDVLELIEKILDIIYEDFGYPVDMENFISYMPNNDEYIPSNHTFEDNRNYLLSKLDDFIDEQIKKYQLERFQDNVLKFQHNIRTAYFQVRCSYCNSVCYTSG